MELESLQTSDVARILRTVTSDAARLDDPTADFRTSVAGAQEKTALVEIEGNWFSPRGSTPTTHILKLPLGIVGNLRLDLASSIENEWLCLQLLRELGLDVASADVRAFRDEVSEERALVVKRFDRLWTDNPRGLIRLPQEDMCQATGTRSANKYESDRGPGIAQVLDILRSGTAPAADIRLFVFAQLAFWLLAAIDGHAKNFSIFLTREGYSLTPLYDVMSAWPIIGHAPNKLPMQRAKLAMAIKCKTRHYEIDRITTRHWKCLAEQSGVPFEEMEALVNAVPAAIDRTSRSLPPGFPEHVWLPIAEGAQQAADRFIAGISAEMR
jgi:serine/threonine-protein kinase HipA